MRIGFIGLGHMGNAMATRLLDRGHRLVVYNRTRSKAELLAPRGATVAESPAAAAHDADVLVTSLSDDGSLEHVMLGEQGAVATLARGSVHLSTSTISPALSERLAEIHAAAGHRYVAAPVLGRPEAAERGELVAVVAGDPQAIETCRPVFEATAKEVRVVGAEPPKANLTKLGVNFFLASVIEVLGEAYALVEGGGVDAEVFLSILNDAMFKSPIIGAYGKKIAACEFHPAGFRLALGAKDVRLAVEAGERKAVPMPLASVLRDRFVAAIAEGLGDADWSAVGRAASARQGNG